MHTQVEYPCENGNPNLSPCTSLTSNQSINLTMSTNLGLFLQQLAMLWRYIQAATMNSFSSSEQCHMIILLWFAQSIPPQNGAQSYFITPSLPGPSSLWVSFLPLVLLHAIDHSYNLAAVILHHFIFPPISSPVHLCHPSTCTAFCSVLHNALEKT